MIKPHEPGLLNHIGKRMAPLLARVLMHGAGARALRLLGIYLEIIQGKGAGTGWDMQGEINVVTAHVNSATPVIFDLGANQGEWTRRVIAALAPRPCQVVMFEPSSYCQTRLRGLDLPNVTLIGAAVGAKPGVATLVSPDPGNAVASLYVRRDTYHQSDHPPTIEQTPVVTIDDTMEELGIEIVDFMKVDVEGHELPVLQGATRALEDQRIRALTFEFGSGNINSRIFFHDLWDFLHPMGYQIYRICPGGVLAPITEYYEDLEHFRSVSNYLATATRGPVAQHSI
jgi:FkbM family methyltransferase